jgi:hypothetical protein
VVVAFFRRAHQPSPSGVCPERCTARTDRHRPTSASMVAASTACQWLDLRPFRDDRPGMTDGSTRRE